MFERMPNPVWLIVPGIVLGMFLGIAAWEAAKWTWHHVDVSVQWQEAQR